MKPKPTAPAYPLSVGHVHRIAHRVFVSGQMGLDLGEPVDAAEPPPLSERDRDIDRPTGEGVIDTFKVIGSTTRSNRSRHRYASR